MALIQPSVHYWQAARTSRLATCATGPRVHRLRSRAWLILRHKVMSGPRSAGINASLIQSEEASPAHSG
jgi:hypothetical protein